MGLELRGHVLLPVVVNRTVRDLHEAVNDPESLTSYRLQAHKRSGLT